MELNEKQLLALVAIGAAFWYLTRKNPATAAQGAVTPASRPAPASGGIWDGFGVGGSLAQAMGQVAAPAPQVAAPAPATAPTVNTKAPVQVPIPKPVDDGFVVGGGASSPATSSPPDMSNPWVQLAIGRYGQ